MYDNEKMNAGNPKPDTVSDSYGCKFDLDMDACSTTECTGLIPSAPTSGAEVEHYNQVFKFLPERAKTPER